MNHAIHFRLPFPPLKMVLLRNYSAILLYGIYTYMYVILVQEGRVFNLSLLLFQLHCVSAIIASSSIMLTVLCKICGFCVIPLLNVAEI